MEIVDTKSRVDFGIITIREDEFEAVLDRFPYDLGIISGRRQYNLRRIAPMDPYTVAVVRCAVQANSEAQQVANALLDELKPRWLLVVGIGGGAPASEFTLGDVVVATEVCDFNVGAVLKDGSREYALHGWMSHPDVAKLAANLPAMRKQLGAWNSAESMRCVRPAMKVSPKALYGDAAWKTKVKKNLEHHVSEGRQEPKVTAGAIACSDLVMKDAELFQVWLKFTRQIIAVEMESAGVHKAAQERHVPFMSIRGLSDIVGVSRDPKWTKYACHSAAAFTRAFLLARPIPVDMEGKQVEETINSAVGRPIDRRQHVNRDVGNSSPIVESATSQIPVKAGDAFKQSSVAPRKINNVTDRYIPLPCAVCGRDLLLDRGIDGMGGIIGFVSTYSTGSKDITHRVYVACKGRCDQHQEEVESRSWKGKGQVSVGWREVAELSNPWLFFSWVSSILRELQGNERVFTESGVKDLNDIIFALAQAVCRSTTEEEKATAKHDLELASQVPGL